LRRWRLNRQSVPGGLDVFDLDHEMKPIRRLEQAQRLPLTCVVEYLQTETNQLEPPAATAGRFHPSTDGRPRPSP
jgi:hypothetical protein